MMLEGAGHRVTETASGRRPGDLMGLAELSGLVPLVSLVLRRLGRPRCADRAAVRLRGHDRSRRRSSPPARRWCARPPART